MWSDVLKIKHIYLQGIIVSIGNGMMTKFWLDPWVYKEPLSVIAPILFELCDNKNISVA